MAAKGKDSDPGNDTIENDLKDRNPAAIPPTHLDDDVDPRPFQVAYRVSIVKSTFFCVLAAIPLCAGFLLAYWFPAHWIRLTCSRCRPARARYVIVTVHDLSGQNRVEVVQHLTQGGVEKTSGDALSTPYIVHRNLRYLYNSRNDSFLLLRGYDQGFRCNEIHAMNGGLSSSEHNDRLQRYGVNSIDVPVKPIYIILLHEVLHPFYIFQVFCTAVWLAEGYYYYAALFALCLIGLLPFNIYLCLAPAQWLPWLWEQLEFIPHPYLYFRLAVVEFAFIYLALTYLLETFVFSSPWLHALLKIVRCKRRPNNVYKHILASIGPTWPPITRAEDVGTPL